MTLGIRNQNPFNVKNDPNDPWEGSIGIDAQGHAIFCDPTYSVRAAVRVLAQKWASGKRTLYQILESYAPDGNTEAYARFVADRMSLLPHHVFDASILNLFSDSGKINSWMSISRMIRAMAEFENFAGYELANSIINSGMALYEYDFCREGG